jgi:hypothetical protein
MEPNIGEKVLLEIDFMTLIKLAGGNIPGINSTGTGDIIKVLLTASGIDYINN